MSQFGSQIGGAKLPGSTLPTRGPLTTPVEDTSSIGLINEGQALENKVKPIISTSHVRKTQFKRVPNANQTGACRVRSFHGKLSDQGLEYMDNQINEWLDAHPEVEIKNVTSSVGTFEGKMREPALILNVWY